MAALHLILTIGTGIGKAPTLLDGLVSTLKQLKPNRYWLVPSASPDSIATADLLRDAMPAAFQPWSASNSYRTIANPDDLHECRAALREVIAVARQAHGRLVINPTSGTKQMSAGATLAALDEEIGEIVFTVGERAEGVVIAGTERMASFSTAAFFRERDLREADSLYRNGAFAAAAALLRKWSSDPDVARALHIARCAHEWHRLNYRAAATSAARFDASLRAHLDALARAVEKDEMSEAVLTDLLAGAEDLRSWGDAEEAATRAYKAMEYAARLRVAECEGSAPCFMGLKEMMERLRNVRDPFADEYWGTSLKRFLDIRNQSMHEIRPVDPREAQSLFDQIWNAIQRHFPSVSRSRPVSRPESLLP